MRPCTLNLINKLVHDDKAMKDQQLIKESKTMSKKNSVKKVDGLAKFESYILALAKIGKLDQIDQAILASEWSSQVEIDQLQTWLVEQKIQALFTPIAETYQAIADFDADTAKSFLNEQSLDLNDEGQVILLERQIEQTTSTISARQLFDSVKNSRKKWLAYELAKNNDHNEKVLSGFSGTDLVNFYFFNCYFTDKLNQFTLAKSISFARQYKPDYVSHGHYRYLESVAKQIGLIES